VFVAMRQQSVLRPTRGSNNLVGQIEVLNTVTNLLADPKYSSAPCALAVVMKSLIEAPAHQAESASFCLALADALWLGDPSTPPNSTKTPPQQNIRPVGTASLAEAPVLSPKLSISGPHRCSIPKQTQGYRGEAPEKQVDDTIQPAAGAGAGAGAENERKSMETFEQLRKLPLLRNLHDTEVKKLVRSFKQIDYPKGAFVMKQNEKITEDSMFYFLASGSVDIVVDGTSVGTREGIYFGEKGLLNDQPRSASIIAVTDIQCMCMTRRDFHQLSRLDDNIKKAFDFRMEVMADRDLKLKKSETITRKDTTRAYRSESSTLLSASFATAQKSTRKMARTIKLVSDSMIFKPENPYRMLWDMVSQLFHTIPNFLTQFSDRYPGSS
jgi:CRP-like cAMP-binding protein